MFEAFLTTTSTEGLRPLGTAPQRSWELVTSTVRQRLGDRHAALFGEPIATEHGDRFDWYAPVEGRAEALTALDAAEAEAVRADLDALTGDIRDLARTIEETGQDAEARRLAEALRNAVEHPSEASLWVVRDPEAERPPQPVLVNWAWVEDRQRAVRGDLSGRDTRSDAVRPAARVAAGAAAGAAVASGPAAARQRGAAGWLGWLYWLLWLLLLLILLAILYLAIPACGIRGVAWAQFCPPPAAAADAAAREAARIEDEIAGLERRIAIADRACQPAPQPASLPEPAPPPATDPDIQRRLDRAGAEQGDLSFSLSWDNTSDLDLHVTCPTGSTVSYRNVAACNGRLDVDANAGNVRRDPVENVFYRDPPGGQYRIRVHLFTARSGSGAIPFTVQLRQGERITYREGRVSRGQPNWTTTFDTGDFR